MLTPEEIERGAAIMTRRMANFHDREDAVQEYRIAAWKALEHVEPGRDPKPYQRASGQNAVKAYWQKKKRVIKAVSLDRTFSQGEKAEPLYNLISTKEPDPSEEAAAQDLVRALRRMIEKLPPRLRKITEMSLEGLSTKEICKRLGFTRQAINRSKNRAQVLLRRHFERKQRLAKSKRKSMRKTDAA